MHAWQFMHPPLQPHARGWLPVGDGHEIRWEVSGNPRGQPALFLHGGPGAGCKGDDRRWLAPAHYRIVLFDQRGAGGSRAADPLHRNTTADLVSDIERLREHLAVEDWLLFGGSWGATLALAYAQQHPRRVRAMVLRGVFLATASERRWLFSADGAAARHPQAAGPFLHCARTNGSVLDAYARLLEDGSGQARLAAARAWLRWEQDLMRMETGAAPAPSLPRNAHDDAGALAAARIGVHYARCAYFLEEGQLLRKAAVLRDIPGVIVQGARDLVTPPAAALALHAAWPASRLVPLAGAGHASTDPAMAAELIAATDAFARGGVAAHALT
jgi:proline iminopeptidase